MAPKIPMNAAALKMRRAQDASQAMKEIEAERLAIRAKTDRLRAERLAREAAAGPAPKKSRATRAAAPKRAQ